MAACHLVIKLTATLLIRRASPAQSRSRRLPTSREKPWGRLLIPLEEIAWCSARGTRIDDTPERTEAGRRKKNVIKEGHQEAHDNGDQVATTNVRIDFEVLKEWPVELILLQMPLPGDTCEDGFAGTVTGGSYWEKLLMRDVLDDNVNQELMPITPAGTGRYWEAELRKVEYNTGDNAQNIKQILVTDHAGLKDIWETELSKVKLSMSSERGRDSKHGRTR